MRIRSNQNESEEMINLSGMIDVLFILIIFFLVTTTFKEEEVDQTVKLPVDARNQSLTQTAGNVIKINVRQNGSYVLMGKQVTEEEIGIEIGADRLVFQGDAGGVAEEAIFVSEQGPDLIDGTGDLLAVEGFHLPALVLRYQLYP